MLFSDIMMLYRWLVGWTDSAQDESDIARKNIRAQPDSLTVRVTSSCQCMHYLIKNMAKNDLSECRCRPVFLATPQNSQMCIYPVQKNLTAIP